MAKQKYSDAAVSDILHNLIQEKFQDGSIQWGDILKAVGDEVAVKNWLSVRNVLQGYINDGWLKRTSDVTKEEYAILRIA